jgi:hypothetical protein
MNMYLGRSRPSFLNTTVTLYRVGLAGQKNGELLQNAVHAGFDVFLTIDRGIEFEQNLKQLKIATVLRGVQSSRLADLKPHVPEILKALRSARPGEVSHVG